MIIQKGIRKLMQFKRLRNLCLSLLAIASISPCLSINATDEKGQSIEITNNVGMGNVSIRINSLQYDKASDSNIQWEQHRTVLPGEVVSEIVSVTNEGEPAWIRVKLDFETKAEVNITENECELVDGWEKHNDGYYYWKKEVATGETVQFLNSITVPSEWTSAQVAKTDFTANVRADAVQTRHFIPDFTREDPWFGTIIEVSAYNYTRKEDATNTGYSVAYEGGAEGLVHKGDDFFSNWNTLMPGDSLEDSVAIRNDYDRKVKMYFRTENEISTDLEEHIYLKIYRGAELIYDGTLAGTKNEMVLAVMDPGTSFVIKYKLDVPAELNNKYDLTDGQVKWIFRAELLGRYTKEGKLTGVQDTTMRWVAGGVAAVAVLGCAVYFLNKKKKEDDEEKK